MALSERMLSLAMAFNNTRSLTLDSSDSDVEMAKLGLALLKILQEHPVAPEITAAESAVVTAFLRFRAAADVDELSMVSKPDLPSLYEMAKKNVESTLQSKARRASVAVFISRYFLFPFLS